MPIEKATKRSHEWMDKGIPGEGKRLWLWQWQWQRQQN